MSRAMLDSLTFRPNTERPNRTIALSLAYLVGVTHNGGVEPQVDFISSLRSLMVRLTDAGHITADGLPIFIRKSVAAIVMTSVLFMFGRSGLQARIWPNEVKSAPRSWLT